jgi:hypothetical protein
MLSMDICKQAGNRGDEAVNGWSQTVENQFQKFWEVKVRPKRPLRACSSLCSAICQGLEGSAECVFLAAEL